MALDVKQIVTLGLGLGFATAFGYHALTGPNTPVASSGDTPHMRPLDSFQLEPIAMPSRLAQPFPDGAQKLPPPTPPEALPPARNIESTSDPLANLTLERDSAATVDPTAKAQQDSFDLGSLELAAPGESLDSNLASESAVSTNESAEGVPNQVLALPSDPVAARQPSEFHNASITSVEVPDGARSTTPAGQASTGTMTRENEDLHVSPAQEQQPAPQHGWRSNPFLNQGNNDSQVGHAAPSGSIPANQNRPASARQVSANEALDPGTDDAAGRSFGNSVLSLNQPESAGLPQANRPAVDVGRNGRLAEIPERDLAMLVDSPAPRSVPLNEAEAQRAAHHIEYGKRLARRGATFSAREEFLKALQVLAIANDETTGSSRHTQALRRATLIMNEARDFATESTEQQIQMNVAQVTEAHQCGLLSPEQAARLTPTEAIDLYFSHAQQQLDIAGGRNPVSAEVFYCMGKLEGLLSGKRSVAGPLETAQSVVFHQAALMSDPNHYRSANELGVLFAKNGRLAQAKKLFERSLIVKQSPQTWQNLAMAHQRLGETRMAELAQGEYQQVAAQEPSGVDALIAWKPVQQFNAEAPPEVQGHVARAPEAPQAESAVQPASNDAPVEDRRSLADRLKDLF